MSHSKYVYFVRRIDGEGPVKIGCSHTPASRLQSFMTWAPYPLTIAATTPGDLTLESRFHSRFIAQHSHREWFHPSYELDDAIAAVRAGTFDFDSLPHAKRLNDRIYPKWPEYMRTGIRWDHRFDVLTASGIEIPKDIKDALVRYRGHGGYFRGLEPLDERGNPELGALVQAFLDLHVHIEHLTAPQRRERRQAERLASAQGSGRAA